MKARALLVSAMIALSGCATHFGEGWSKSDTIRQATVTGVIYYDLGVQTPKYTTGEQYHAPDGAIGAYHETNGMISEGNRKAYMAGAILGHALISACLKPKYRKYWQYGWIIIQGIQIMENHKLEKDKQSTRR